MALSGISGVRMKDGLSTAVLKYRLKADGVLIGGPNFGREIGNMAKALGVDSEELKGFIRRILHEIVDEVLAPKEETEKK